MKTMLKVLSLAALIAASAPLARATILTPNAAPVAPGSTTAGDATSGTLVGTASGDVSPGTFHATWTESVYANATGNTLAGCGPTSGCLDFVFSFNDLDPNGDGLNEATENLFKGFTVDADVFGSGTAPTGVSLSNSGVVNWLFTAPNNVEAGTSSDSFVLYTNALYTTPGNFTLQDGSTSNSPDIAPTATPEPSSLMLLGTGLMTVVGVTRRKFKA